jgi:hypothetical protein
MSDYAHKPGGSLKFKGEGEKCALWLIAVPRTRLTMQKEEEEVSLDHRPGQAGDGDHAKGPREGERTSIVFRPGAGSG